MPGVHMTLIYGVILLASCVIGLYSALVYDGIAEGEATSWSRENYCCPFLPCYAGAKLKHLAQMAFDHMWLVFFGGEEIIDLHYSVNLSERFPAALAEFTSS